MLQMRKIEAQCSTNLPAWKMVKLRLEPRQCNSRNHFFFLRFFFWIWTIFEVFNEFVKILLLLLMFWFFGHKAWGILASQPGIEPTPPCNERFNHWTSREVPEIIFLDGTQHWHLNETCPDTVLYLQGLCIFGSVVLIYSLILKGHLSSY